MAFDKNHISTPGKVVIVIFCVILVLMLMLPSLSAIIGNRQFQQQQQQAQSNQQQKIPTTPEEIDAQYQPAVEALEKRLADDPQNVALQTTVADTYFDWGLGLAGMIVLSNGENADQQQADREAHIREVFGKAQEHYDKVIEISPSNAVIVDRAIATFYKGEQQDAITALEDFISQDQTYAPAYANLGMFYEMTGDYDKARENYNTAKEKDADGTYKVASFVDSRVAAMEARIKAEQDAANGSSDQSAGQSADQSGEQSNQ